MCAINLKLSGMHDFVKAMKELLPFVFEHLNLSNDIKRKQPSTKKKVSNIKERLF